MPRGGVSLCETEGYMTDILARIITEKRKVIPSTITASSYKPCPFLHKNSFQVIAEIKRGSPSLGLVSPNLSIEDTLRRYEAIGVSAVSVLTEEVFFYGSLKDLESARALTQLPLLRKDFMVDIRQISESQYFGADAILIIMAAFVDDVIPRQLLAESKRLGLSVLTEVHNKVELDRALSIGAEIIGVNNRDLHSFKTDIGVSLELAKFMPSEIIKVTESGIKTAADLMRLRDAGYNAALIGEAFLNVEGFDEVISQL